MEIKNLYDRDDYEKYKEIINMITDESVNKSV